MSASACSSGLRSLTAKGALGAGAGVGMDEQAASRPQARAAGTMG